MSNKILKTFHKTIHERLVTLSFAKSGSWLYGGLAIQNPIDKPNKELGEKIASNRVIRNKVGDNKVQEIARFSNEIYLNGFVLEQIANTIFIQFENHPERFIAKLKK